MYKFLNQEHNSQNLCIKIIIFLHIQAHLQMRLPNNKSALLHAIFKKNYPIHGAIYNKHIKILFVIAPAKEAKQPNKTISVSYALRWSQCAETQKGYPTAGFSCF